MPLQHLFLPRVLTNTGSKKGSKRCKRYLRGPGRTKKWYRKAGIQGHEEGRQEGRQEGFQQAAINIVVARFAPLESLASTKITAINDLRRLHQLIIDLSISRDQEEVRQVLLSLDGDNAVQ